MTSQTQGGDADAVRIVFETALGAVIAELYPDRAPITTANFLRHVDQGLYDGAAFYRTMRPGAGERPNRALVIQGGVDPSCRNPPLPPIPLESTEITGLSHLDGTLSIARWEPDTGASEFFVVIGDSPILDYGAPAKPDGQGFAAFGRVVQGMDIVRAINAAPADAPTAYEHMRGQALSEPVAVRITRLPATTRS
jgi:peptidyl-prolyl cis-trans isomerase A (cyclophilin A)